VRVHHDVPVSFPNRAVRVSDTNTRVNSQPFPFFFILVLAALLPVDSCVTTASIAVYETSGNLRDLDFDNDEMCTTYRNEKIWKGHFCDEGFECMKVVNPNYGVTNFDSLLPALLLIFQVSQSSNPPRRQGVGSGLRMRLRKAGALLIQSPQCSTI
jgi:hypothetical protein